MPEAMKNAMNRIEQQFSIDPMAEFRRPAVRLVKAEQEIYLQIGVISGFESEYVGGTGDVAPASVGGIHLGVPDDSDRDPFGGTRLHGEDSPRYLGADQSEYVVKSLQYPIPNDPVHQLTRITTKAHGGQSIAIDDIHRPRFGRVAITGHCRLAFVFPCIAVHIHPSRLRGSFRPRGSR